MEELTEEEDVGITVITLQNLDDQTQTTCLRTDVAPSVQPTLINELTPVEIKYDEYEPEGQLVLGLDNDDSIVKNELLQHGAQSGLQRRNELRSNAAPVNVPPEETFQEFKLPSRFCLYIDFF